MPNLFLPGISAPTKPASSSGPRPPSSRKIPARKIEVQPTKLEAVDDSLDPLGPLGGGDPAPAAPSISVDQAPTPPRKELGARVNRQPSGAPSGAEYEDSTLPLGRPKGPPPVQPQAGAPPLRQTPSSVSIEQAAKPTFHILVGDPHKVGDLTSSHIVYQVRTKVRGGQNGTLQAVDMCRQPRRHTSSPSLPCHGDIE